MEDSQAELIDEEARSHILARAATLDAALNTGAPTRVASVREAAIAAGIAPSAIDQAIQDWRTTRVSPPPIAEQRLPWWAKVVNRISGPHGLLELASSGIRLRTTATGHAPQQVAAVTPRIRHTFERSHLLSFGTVTNETGRWEVWRMPDHPEACRDQTLTALGKSGTRELWVQIRADGALHDDGARVLVRAVTPPWAATGDGFGLTALIGGTVSILVWTSTGSAAIAALVMTGIAALSYRIQVRSLRGMTQLVADRLSDTPILRS